jgi:hypothetical protein
MMRTIRKVVMTPPRTVRGLVGIVRRLRKTDRESFLRAIGNPAYGIRELYKHYALSANALPPEQFLATVTGRDVVEIRRLRTEVETSAIMTRAFKIACERERTRGTSTFGGVSEFDFMNLYILVRLIGPKEVIETGVAAGVSSTAILLALHKNREGKLHSIDLPPEQVVGRTLSDGMRYDKAFVGGLTPGWIVPQELRDRWQLILGDVKEVLPPLLTQIQAIDMFFHDDLHTPDHMLWEFNLVWPFLNEKGALISDDLTYGWFRFMRKHRFPISRFLNCDGLGAVLKR